MSLMRGPVLSLQSLTPSNIPTTFTPRAAGVRGAPTTRPASVSWLPTSITLLAVHSCLDEVGAFHQFWVVYCHCAAGRILSAERDSHLN
jgi:hypothetical protein